MEARKFSRGTPAEVQRRLAERGHIHGYQTVYKRLTEGNDRYTLDIAAEIEAEKAREAKGVKEVLEKIGNIIENSNEYRV